MAKTYLDIQKMTGLSLSTISKYFNGGTLREPNRAAIERAIEALDYRVNEFARGLKSRRSRKVGVLIPELTSTFHTVIMSEVCHILRQAGYDTVVCDCHLNKQIERDALQFLLDKMVDGIITIPLNRDGTHLRLAEQREIPVVLIDRLTSKYRADAVIVDNRGAGAMAARKLAEAGHTSIALISGLPDVYTMRERTAGFFDTLEELGIRRDPSLVREVEFVVDGGYHAALDLLRRPAPPTALFCANYELTLGMIIAVNELGLRVGEELSVVGFDNLQLARIIKPRMTMIVQPMQDIAKNAARLMINRLESPTPGINVIELPTQLVEGDSVRQM